ncbi:transposase [Rathayibacter agropyri]|uniref:transposase n=1 Tax=Rathayibacter agropyri TaxID=1634927 RepID=UPI003CCCD023
MRCPAASTTRKRSESPGSSTRGTTSHAISETAATQDAPPRTLAAWIQGHWGIENRVHWVRDVAIDEDRSQTRTGNGSRVMATLRSTAISLLRLDGHTNIAAALRHHALDTARPTKLILTN